MTVFLPSLKWPDPKRVNRALFGAYYEEDIYDRFCTAVPGVMRLFRGRIPAAMRARNLIFVHVPRVAGTSISTALYGPSTTHHQSARYFRALDPAFFARAGSFALLRDPFDHVASGFGFIRAQGASDCSLSRVFAEQTAHIRTVDDYLSFIEGRGTFDLDFTMRPQSWFVCDLKSGRPLVKNLFLYGEDSTALAAYLNSYGVASLPWLNRGDRAPLDLTERQRARIRAIYAQDFALIESVRAARLAGQGCGTVVAAE